MVDSRSSEMRRTAFQIAARRVRNGNDARRPNHAAPVALLMQPCSENPGAAGNSSELISWMVTTYGRGIAPCHGIQAEYDTKTRLKTSKIAENR